MGLYLYVGEAVCSTVGRTVFLYVGAIEEGLSHISLLDGNEVTIIRYLERVSVWV